MKITAREAMQREEADVQRQIHERMLEEFIARYAPEDRYEAAQFNAALGSIMRQLSADMQKPLHDAYLGAIALRPYRPMFMGFDKARDEND